MKKNINKKTLGLRLTICAIVAYIELTASSIPGTTVLVAPSGQGEYQITPNIGVNVREFPTTLSNRINGIGKGVRVTISRIENGVWGYVEGYNGCIHLDFADYV